MNADAQTHFRSHDEWVQLGSPGPVTPTIAVKSVAYMDARNQWWNSYNSGQHKVNWAVRI